MAIQSDLMIAINQIAAERNIDATAVIEAIKEAIKTGFRKDYPEEQETLLEVEIDPEKEQSIRVYANKKVVEAVVTKATQIGLREAMNIDKRLKVGDHVLVDVTPSGDFGRVAAQVAKQVILQKIRETEKEVIMKEFDGRIGEIEYGVVQRMDGEDVIFEIHRAQAVMPSKDKIPGEFYRSGSRMKVLLKEIKMTPRGKQLIVSRSDNEFLVGLFKLEVPEISSGTVEIKSIAREAGSRSKVAVFSTTDGIDPIGACVGQKGVRINAVLNDLKFGAFEEKIDIILWNAENSVFIANSLSPAQVTQVVITDEEERKAKAFVPDEQLSLAIGKEGQNVRLGAKLTGWNIDILGESLREEELAKLKPVKAPKAEKVEKVAKADKAEKTESVEGIKEVSEAVAEEKASKPAKKAVKTEKVEKKPAKKAAEKKETVKKVAAKKAPAKKAVKK